MARSDEHGNDSGSATEPKDLRAGEKATAKPSATAPKEPDRLARRFGAASRAERDRIISQAREIKFPVGLRGYDRAAVDRYVEQVNRLIAELEISSSPESAVRHALDEVGEETRDLLQRAHQTADDILARARARSDDTLQQAEREAERMRELGERDSHRTSDAAAHESQKLLETAQREAADLREAAARDATEMRESASRDTKEARATAKRETEEARATAERETDDLRATARHQAHEMLEAAETRARELALNAETIWRERRRLLEDVQGIGQQLVAMGEAEAKRFPHVPDGATTAAGAVPSPSDPAGAGPSVA
jgi:DivIVA domain-containing protein